jgi:hypothetical protein
VDDHWIIALDIEHPDLEQRSVGRRSDEHHQVIIEKYTPHGVANRVPYVRIGNAVLSRWLTDAHPDNIACLDDGTIDCCRRASVGAIGKASPADIKLVLA